MQGIVADTLTLALFNLGGEEVILILALCTILFGAKKLPELARGIGNGISEFRKAWSEILREIPGRTYPPVYVIRPWSRQVPRREEELSNLLTSREVFLHRSPITNHQLRITAPLTPS